MFDTRKTEGSVRSSITDGETGGGSGAHELPFEDTLWLDMLRRHRAMRAELASRHSPKADIIEGLKMDVETLLYSWVHIRPE